MTACIAFSIAKPYRQPMWSNYYLFISLILVTIVDILILIIPASNPFMFAIFNDLDFCSDPTDVPITGPFDGPLNHAGTCYPKYYVRLGIIVLINSFITYIVEAFFIRKFTVSYDLKTETKKITHFQNEMEALIPLQRNY